MAHDRNEREAIELLQSLGLKEYEARSFVALTRLPEGTAKEVSEVSEVPRTRIYDAVQVLESRGLVEIQHANPQRFRAVSIEEAVETLRAEYESRADDLRSVLERLDSVGQETDREVTHEVWALSGETTIETRTRQLVDDAESELVLVVGHESAITDRLVDRLRAAMDRNVEVLVGTISEELRASLTARLPDAEVFVSELQWLDSPVIEEDETEISRLLMADRETILVSSFHPDRTPPEEHAVFGRGFDNGLVVIVRRLMAVGLDGGE